MSTVLRNIIICVAGLVLGNAVNFATLIAGFKVIPPPEGFDMTDPGSFERYADQFTAMHYIFPLLAHSLGTLVATYLICRLVDSRERYFAIGVGVLFLIAGIVNLSQIPAPTWFAVVDLALAYLPMAWLGFILAMKAKSRS